MECRCEKCNYQKTSPEPERFFHFTVLLIMIQAPVRVPVSVGVLGEVAY